jgi:hypothetical protein
MQHFFDWLHDNRRHLLKFKHRYYSTAWEPVKIWLCNYERRKGRSGDQMIKPPRLSRNDHIVLRAIVTFGEDEWWRGVPVSDLATASGLPVDKVRDSIRHLIASDKIYLMCRISEPSLNLLVRPNGKRQQN